MIIVPEFVNLLSPIPGVSVWKLTNRKINSME